MKKTKSEDDAQANVVTQKTITDAMEELESLKIGFQSILDEMKENGYEKLETSNWSSSGKNALVLLGRSLDAMWTAIGAEKTARTRIKMVQEKAKKMQAGQPMKAKEE